MTNPTTLEDYAIAGQKYMKDTKDTFTSVFIEGNNGGKEMFMRILDVFTGEIRNFRPNGKLTRIFMTAKNGQIFTKDVPVIRDDQGNLVAIRDVSIYNPDGSYNDYRLKDFFDKVQFTGIQVVDNSQPQKLQESNYPNPFNPDIDIYTNIAYKLSEDVDVKIEFRNTNGQLIRTLDLGYQQAGDRVARWDGRNEVGEKVSDGVYFYTIKAGKSTVIGKMVVGPRPVGYIYKTEGRNYINVEFTEDGKSGTAVYELPNKATITFIRVAL